MLRNQAFFLLSFLFAVFSSGCTAISTTEFASYEVNVGAPTIGVATGATAIVRIGVRERGHESYGGYGAAPQLPTLSVDHVTCSPDCVATANIDSSYDVSATTAGLRTVELTFSTSDGKRSVKSATIDFRDATRIDVRRGGTSPSGSVYAMVPGDEQWWNVSVADANGPLFVGACEPDVTATGAIAADDRRCSETVGIQAVTPGSGTVTMRYGNLVRTETITVIDPVNIRQVELREVLIPSDALVAIESADGVLAPLRTPLVFADCGSHLVVPQLTTADGTIAYGGANLLGAIPSNVEFVPYSEVVEVSFNNAASGTFRGYFGSSADTTLSVPFVVQSNPACGS